MAAIALTGGIALGLIAPGLIAGGLGIGLTASALASALTLTASALSIAAGIMAKKPSFASVSSGQQLEWTADPTAGTPYVMGNARVGEAIVHQASWGDTNRFLGIVGVLSCAGPIEAYDGFYADNSLITIPSADATGYYAGFLRHNSRLGSRFLTALPMAAPDGSIMPDWSINHGLSSLAASGLILTADIDKGKVYSGGTPKFTHQIRGVKAYDARVDDTNGGTGAHRRKVEGTYTYSENPWVHHGTYAMGRWVKDVRVIGPGLFASSIDWSSHIEAANVADANGWAVSGRVLSTDRKWEVLKAIAQAGGGYPAPSGTKLSCLVNTPRVSLETIEEEHLKGPVSAPQMSMRRSRLNGAIPRFRSPDHAWEIVSGDAVRNATWLAADGGTTRTREIDLPLVADKTQAAQLVAYDVANSRERSPISVELDLYWSQYKVGDCLSLNIPSALLVNQKAIIIGRELDAASNTVRFEFRTEDDAKHAWALGQTGTAPPPTTVGSPPGAGDTGGDKQLSVVLTNSYPKSLRITATDAGTDATIKLDGGSAGAAFIIDYATTPREQVTVPAGDIMGLNFSTTYYPYADVDEAGDATPTYGATTVYGNAINSATNPNRLFLGRAISTPADGGADTTGTGTGSPGGFDPGAGGGPISYP